MKLVQHHPNDYNIFGDRISAECYDYSIPEDVPYGIASADGPVILPIGWGSMTIEEAQKRIHDFKKLGPIEGALKSGIEALEDYIARVYQDIEENGIIEPLKCKFNSDKFCEGFDRRHAGDREEGTRRCEAFEGAFGKCGSGMVHNELHRFV